MGSQRAVSGYFTIDKILPSGFAGQYRKIARFARCGCLEPFLSLHGKTEKANCLTSTFTINVRAASQRPVGSPPPVNAGYTLGDPDVWHVIGRNGHLDQSQDSRFENTDSVVQHFTLTSSALGSTFADCN